MLAWIYKKLLCCAKEEKTPAPTPTSSSSEESGDVNTLAYYRRHRLMSAAPRPQEL